MKRPLRVLVACESSGVVRDAFNALGHVATSCDLLPCEGRHHQGSVFEIINQRWDLMICHPPCTYLSSSGMHWTINGYRCPLLTCEAVQFAKLLWSADIPRIAMENPVGVLSTEIQEPDQYIQPYRFGHDASKGTGLWLKNLSRLKNTKYIKPRIVNGRKRWGNQTDSGQNALPPRDGREKERSKTYDGIAQAMAIQWGGDTGWRDAAHVDDPESDHCLLFRGELEYRTFHNVLMARPKK